MAGHYHGSAAVSRGRGSLVLPPRMVQGDEDEGDVDDLDFLDDDGETGDDFMDTTGDE